MSNIPVSELTETSLDGDGIFDVLMRSTGKHLQEEFDKGRIRGTEYANAYTQSLATVMQQSLTFLLEREKAFYQAELLREQVESEKKTQANIEAQTCKLKAEFDLIEQQISKTAAEVQLLIQKRITEEAQTQNGVANPDSVLGRQISLYKAQADGFKRDAEQKAVRIFTDAVAVSDGIDSVGSFNLRPYAPLFKEQSLNTVLQKLLDGISQP